MLQGGRNYKHSGLGEEETKDDRQANDAEEHKQAHEANVPLEELCEHRMVGKELKWMLTTVYIS